MIGSKWYDREKGRARDLPLSYAMQIFMLIVLVVHVAKAW